MKNKNMTRRKALQRIGVISAGSVIPQFIQAQPERIENPYEKSKSYSGNNSPNIVLIICDQIRADVCKREGFSLDTTPFLDTLARSGIWFNKAYTSAPVCVPARTSLIAGRFPNATRIKSNHNIKDVIYSEDMIDVVKSRGYKTALIGKNHTYLTPDRFDYWKEYKHLGVPYPNTSEERTFNDYLKTTNFYADYKPAPFPAEMQQPYRIVTDAQNWIASLQNPDSPFFLKMSFPEPHSPYQISEPYYSLFPPDKLPPVLAGKEFRETKGKKFMIQAELQKKVRPNFEENIPRIRSNYFGMLRLIDDQIKRFVGYLKENGLYESTLLIFLSDHGDFVGEYGLTLKGVGLPECLARIPMIWHGPGIIKQEEPHKAHISIVDVFPTICDTLGVRLPDGVQGRSIWPLLTGEKYPEEEFSSVLVQQGTGGLDYTSLDQLDPYKYGGQWGGLVKGKKAFDELNSWSQSGILRMLRKEDWKLVYDMQGRGQLYHLLNDPAEINNLYNHDEYKNQQMELLQDMMAWELRTQDPMPLSGYIYRRDPRNYWMPYRSEM